MATINAYGAKFIGNDFVAPRVRQQAAWRATEAKPQYTPQAPLPVYEAATENVTYEPATADYGTQAMPTRQPAQAVTRPLTLRSGLIALSAVILITGLVVAVPRLPAAWHAARTVANRIALGASVDLHHTKPHSFAMPQHAILIKNSELSTFVDAIEGQQITINVGGAAVTPTALDIQKWFTTSAGPEKGSTIMQASTANISAYVASVAQKHAPSASSAALSNATSQLAGALLKYNGATISLASN